MNYTVFRMYVLSSYLLYKKMVFKIYLKQNSTFFFWKGPQRGPSGPLGPNPLYRALKAPGSPGAPEVNFPPGLTVLPF